MCDISGMPVTQSTAKTQNKKKSTESRRSACPIACSLDILGDRWTLLVIRDLFLGRTRFKDFTASPEHIPTNILTERLQRLLDHQIIEQTPAEEGGKRLAYRLTQKGQALGPMLKQMRDWGLKWEPRIKVIRRD